MSTSRAVVLKPLDNWQWAYFGDKETDRVFFVAQKQKDNLIDHFAYMGDTKEGNEASDGMVVFGFGRDKGAQPMMTQTGVNFTIGFLNRKIVSSEDHEWGREQINKKIND